MFFLRKAMELGSVLVLPRIRLLARHQRRLRNHSEAERLVGREAYVAWSDLYNLSALAALHPVVPLAEIHDRSISLHVRRGPCATSARQNVSDFVRLSGERMTVVEQVCDPHLLYSLPRMYGLSQRHESIVITDSHDELPRVLSEPLRAYVRFSSETYNAAAGFIRDSLHGEAFVAVHWRRGDFVGLRPATQVHHAARVIGHVRRLLQAQPGVRRVYLASDAPTDDPEMTRLVAALQPVRTSAISPQLLRMTPRSPPHGVALLASLEIAVCAMAPYFLGSSGSSFTYTILEERSTIFGHGAHTGGEMLGDQVVGWDEHGPAGRLKLHPLPLPAQPPPRLRVVPPRHARIRVS